MACLKVLSQHVPRRTEENHKTHSQHTCHFYSLFCYAVSISDCTASNNRMTGKLGRIWKEVLMA
jgi:hypothetical protein